MTREQFNALVGYIDEAARYAADDIMNRNDVSDSLRKSRTLEKLEDSFGFNDKEN